MAHDDATILALDAPETLNDLQPFFRMAELWNLSTEQQITLLGKPARSTFFKWKKEGGAISNDTAERVSHLISIYKALQILLPNPSGADDWLHRSNRVFEGRTALDVMLGGGMADLIAVRTYLDNQRGG
jgi:hypothetical protein